MRQYSTERKGAPVVKRIPCLAFAGIENFRKDLGGVYETQGQLVDEVKPSHSLADNGIDYDDEIIPENSPWKVSDIPSGLRPGISHL